MIELVKKRWFQVVGVLVILISVFVAPRLMRLEVASEGTGAVAEVKGEKITEFQFKVAINRRLLRITSVEGRFSSSQKEDVMLAVFKELLNDKILEITAENMGVTVTNEDLESKRQNLINMLEKMYMKDNPNVRPGFKQYTGEDLYNNLWSSMGFRHEMEFLQNLKYEILEEKLSKKMFPPDSYIITDEEVDEYMPVVELRQIFFNYNPAAGAEQPDINFANKKTLKQAWDIYERIQQGEDFAELAKQYSQEASAVNGGLIGWINKRSVVPEFWKRASVMEPGDVTEPFTTDYGIHILKCIRRASPDNPRLQDFRDLMKKTVEVRKRKSDFVGWFYREFKRLEEEDKIILYHPVLKANKLRNMGEYSDAIEEYRKAIARDDEGAPYYHLDIAWIMARQKRFTEALREIRKATEKAPTDPMLFFKMGEAYMDVGEHEKGIREFRKASEMSKLNYELHRRLMLIFNQLGLPEEAKQEQERMRHAIELLGGGGQGMAPGSFFKPTDFNAPPPAAGTIDQDTPSVTPGLDLGTGGIPEPPVSGSE
mgnify:CR=1 FL=1